MKEIIMDVHEDSPKVSDGESWRESWDTVITVPGMT